MQSYSKAPRILAGLSFILFSIFRYFPGASFLIHDMLYYSYSPDLEFIIEYLFPVPMVISSILLISTGIFIMSEKRLPVAICFGLHILYEILYPFIAGYDTLLFYYFGYDFFESLHQITYWILIFTLFTYSILALINPKMQFLRLWFIPAILSFMHFTADIIYSIYIIDYFPVLYSITGIFRDMIFCIASILYFVSLAQRAKKPVVIDIPAVAPPQEDSLSECENTQSTDTATELREYKKLLDEGLITEEDYNIKKSQLLKL